MINNPAFQERIYNLVNGFWNLEHYPVPESAFVPNEFIQGSFCAEAYGKVLDAYARICARLQQDSGEDADVEIILNEMNGIMKHISIKMFQYGAFFARKD